MTVNRFETCPTLIRTFYQRNEHHSITDFVKTLPSPELYLYTWRDATLRELAHAIVRSAKLPDVQNVSFNMIFPEVKLGGWSVSQLGVVDLRATMGEEKATLESYGFLPGYFLDVAYTTGSQT
jgi:hypothetical protein